MASQESADSEVGITGIGGRYASALFDLAEDGGVLDAVRDELTQLGDLLKESADFAQFVRSPLYDKDAQGRALSALLSKAGASDLVIRFVGVVVQNRRLFALPEIIRAYQALVARHRGEVTARVISAHTLSDAQKDKLKAAIENTIKSDVQLDTKVDPDLLGGFVVKIGSRMIDSSIRTQLNRLQSVMKEA